MSTVGEIIIDFYVINTGSPKLISIYDNSNWEYASNLPAYLVIKIPGSKKEINFSFVKNNINTLNSHNLGLSCLKGNCTEEEYVNLPDGIYTVTLKSGYEEIEETKFYLKTDTFDIEFAKVIIKYGVDYFDQGFINYMTKVRFLVDVAQSHTKLGDFVKAQRHFEEAKKMLNAYVTCKKVK